MRVPSRSAMLEAAMLEAEKPAILEAERRRVS
jgi:hypothetical protein